MAHLQVQDITKSFGAAPVLRGVSFEAADGEIVCLLGPSGCGKTTALRIVAGLERAETGRVLLDGEPIDDVPVHRRGFGLMFQDLALLPHKDVAANVAFGLRMQARPAAEVRSRTAEMLDLVGLAGYGPRRVFELSGGEQQRVALARSLAPGPRLLMLDEPLGSLDRALREELMVELRHILKRVGVTALYVTHDQQEAFALADRLLLMRRGLIVQSGPPQAVYAAPASAWAARFLGLGNLLPGHVVAAGAPEPGGWALVDTPIGRLPAVIAGSAAPAAGQAVTVLIRPDAAYLPGDPAERAAALAQAVAAEPARRAGAAPAAPAAGPDGGPALWLDGVVAACSFRGAHSRLTVRPAAAPEVELAFELRMVGADLPDVGRPVRLGLRPEAIGLLRDEGEP